MQDYGKKTALFRHDYAQPDAIRSREAKYPRYTAKICQTGWLCASNYQNLCHFSKNTGIRGLTARKYAIYGLFFNFSDLQALKTICPGNAARSKNVMFLSKNVMSFFLRGPMNTSHTFGKRTELYSNFYAGSPAP